MSWRTYAVFLLLTATWLAATVLVLPIPFGYLTGKAIIGWGVTVMTLAAGYYSIQEAPAARVTGWLRRDLVLNIVLFLALLLALLNLISNFLYFDLRTTGWIAFATAAIHPLAVDWPHLRHHRDDPAGSPIPMYVPPACIAIDWTLALLILAGLTLLG